VAKRSESDEHYVIDLCDHVLGARASRQHRFEWLRGDWSEKKQSFSYLPVDGFWEHLGLVVEFAERQHNEAVPIFDQRTTVSGVSRGQQRRIYDERRLALIPQNGLALVTLAASDFTLKRHKIVRQDSDGDVVSKALSAFI
jgi:hypothetical protein